MFDFIKDLSESRLFPTVQELKKHSDKDLGEWLILNLCALRILLAVEGTRDYARVYARKTASFNKFDKWRSDGNDLYTLLQSCSHVDDGGKTKVGQGLNMPNVLAWLRQAAREHPDEHTTRRLFVRLDFDLKVRNESIKAIRRLTTDWYRIDHRKKQLVFTRLLQFFRTRMRRSELLVQMEKVARHHDLELHGVDNQEDDSEIVKYQ